MKRKGVMMSMALLVAGVAWAQSQQPSLGDLARQEAERRKAAKPPTKVYTNADVKARPVTTGTSGTESTGKTQDVKKDGATAESASKPDSSTKPQGERTSPGSMGERDEAWWRARMTQITESLNRNRILAEALQSRVNALLADFAARDDPAQRGVIEANRREALAELDRVKVEIARQQQALSDLEEEARRAGVPPGWLR